MLFLVVICLKLSNIVFAVDSVSAIVSAVNCLFLAYTSTVFAMRGLRATYFIIGELVKLFSLLKYGVGIILAVVCFKCSCERLLRGRAQLREVPGNGISDSLCPAPVLLPIIFRSSWSTSAASVRRQRSKLYYDGSSSTPVVTASKAASKAALRAGHRQIQSLHQDYCSDNCAQAATSTTSRSTAAVMQQRLRSEWPFGKTCHSSREHLRGATWASLVQTPRCSGSNEHLCLSPKVISALAERRSCERSPLGPATTAPPHSDVRSAAQRMAAVKSSRAGKCG